jgi:hypothetical protein
MMRRIWCLTVLTLVLTAGCGTTSTPNPPGVSKATNASTEGTKPGPVVLDVTIIDGEVTPRGARVELRVGQPLTLSVHSDAAAEVHVHTDPEQGFKVKAGGNKRFTFTVDQPGKVAVEVHEPNVEIAEVLVRK